MRVRFVRFPGLCPCVRALVASGVLALVLSGCVGPGTQSKPSAAQQELQPDEPRVELMRHPSTHWAFLYDDNVGVIGRIIIVDGDAQRVVGSIAAGFLPSFTLTRNLSEYVLGETYWSRGSRGKRTDVITYYDPTTLLPLGETALPQGRFLIGKRYALAMTGDGKFLLSANATPATSVSIIDFSTRTVVAAVTTPGCALVLPHGTESFSSLCGNGSFMTVRLEADGTAQKVRGKPFFDPDVDPVFDDWALSQQERRAFFVSYHGQIYSVSLAGEQPEPERTPWHVTTERERQEGWRPGGTQPLAYHSPSHRLFVLMHRDVEWTQFESGTEVWIFDAMSHQRLGRLHLAIPAMAVEVTRDESALLFTLDGKSRLSTYRETAKQWRHVGDLGELGEVALLTVPETGAPGADSK